MRDTRLTGMTLAFPGTRADAEPAFRSEQAAPYRQEMPHSFTYILRMSCFTTFRSRITD